MARTLGRRKRIGSTLGLHFIQHGQSQTLIKTSCGNSIRHPCGHLEDPLKKDAIESQRGPREALNRQRPSGRPVDRRTICSLRRNGDIRTDHQTKRSNLLKREYLQYCSAIQQHSDRHRSHGRWIQRVSHRQQRRLNRQWSHCHRQRFQRLWNKRPCHRHECRCNEHKQHLDRLLHNNPRNQRDSHWLERRSFR